MPPRKRRRTATATRRKATTRRRTTVKRRKIKIKLKQSVLREIWGILCLGGAVLLFMSLAGQAGPIGTMIQDNIFTLFGRGAYIFPLTLIVAGCVFIFSKKVQFNFMRISALFVGFASILGVIHLGTPSSKQLDLLYDYGGYTGFVASFLLRHFFEETAAAVILSIIFIASMLVVFDITLSKLILFFRPSKLGIPKISVAVDNDEKSERSLKEEQTQKAQKFEVMNIVKPKGIDADTRIKEAKKPSLKEIVDPPPPKIKNASLFESKEEEQTEVKKFDNERYNDWKFPDLDLLDDEHSELEIDEKILRATAVNIKEKLKQFGIDVAMRDINVGPTVTQFTLEPSEGIKLNKITALKNDLALALAAKSIRIEAPIPGKALVGIEIPNSKRMTVRLRELLETKEYKEMKSGLRLIMGRDVSGKPIIADLESMPHLLIAGRTGAGKSVCMNSFLISLLYQYSPRDLKFIMIDPKMVELVGYNGISHLLAPVITDTEKAVAALRWTVSEMTRRYRELNEKRYRNVTEYNDNEEEKMCKIVVVVDELADLMMRGAKKETEGLICRLAQMARAVGIHLVIATQRPSVDVITGLIKANIPARVSFAVSSGVDSRTILDSYGAEDLLGHGDMLFVPGGMSSAVRIQGVYVSSKEIERVTNRVKLTLDPEYDESITEELTSGSKPAGGGSYAGGDHAGSDDKYAEAVEVVKKTGRASATLLQRYMGIGYARAAKILDEMEENGLIGPSRGAKPREIYMTSGEEEEVETL